MSAIANVKLEVVSSSVEKPSEATIEPAPRQQGQSSSQTTKVKRPRKDVCHEYKQRKHHKTKKQASETQDDDNMLTPEVYEAQTLREFREINQKYKFFKNGDNKVCCTNPIPKGTKMIIPGKAITRTSLNGAECYKIRDTNVLYAADLFKATQKVKFSGKTYTLYLQEDTPSERDNDTYVPIQQRLDLQGRIMYVNQGKEGDPMTRLSFTYDQKRVLGDVVDARWLVKPTTDGILDEVPYAGEGQEANLTVELVSDTSSALECKRVILTASRDIQAGEVLTIKKDDV